MRLTRAAPPRNVLEDMEGKSRMSGTARTFSLTLLAVAALLASSASAGITGASRVVAPASPASADFSAALFVSGPRHDPLALPRLASADSASLLLPPEGSSVPAESPPVPGSLALVLSALGSLGAYQGLRVAKRLPLGGVAPDWYHAEGPQQIGHATALDITRLDVSSLARFETTFDLFHAAGAPGASAAPEFTPPRAQSILLIESPRAPPTR